jgi:D-alanyl-D-alanine carboxypeptidase (penicillin-binding protein 5/6)
VGAFVDLMNERAGALGLRHTAFASPDGWDNAGHSTAGDLAKLTRIAMANATFAGIVGTKRASVHSLTGPLRVVQNRNVLLWLYPQATGVKTGFTAPAGHCVIATAERDGVRLLAVVLGAPEDAFSDAAALLNYGFTAFVRTTVAVSGKRLGTLTIGGRPVPVVVGATLVALVPKSARLVLRLQEARALHGPCPPSPDLCPHRRPPRTRCLCSGPSSTSSSPSPGRCSTASYNPPRRVRHRHGPVPGVRDPVPRPGAR